MVCVCDGDGVCVMVCVQSSEHADHEYTQIIMLVALLRQHFQRQQDKHTHSGLITSKMEQAGHRRSGRGRVGAEDGSIRLRLPTLTRAKNVIANSFENLRSKPPLVPDKKAQMSAASVVVEEDKSEGLFARKTSINTLMSLVQSGTSSNREEEEEEGGREQAQIEERSRSWTEGQVSPPSLHLQEQTQAEEDRVSQRSEQLSKEDGGRRPGMLVSPPEPVGGREGSSTSLPRPDEDRPGLLLSLPAHVRERDGRLVTLPEREKEREGLLQSLPSIPAQDIGETEDRYLLHKMQHVPRARSLRELELRKDQRHLSLTPPSSAAVSNEGKFHKEHRRAVSYSIGSSWRREIFESVVTPTKKDKYQRRTTSHDICKPCGLVGVGGGGGLLQLRDYYRM